MVWPLWLTVCALKLVLETSLCCLVDVSLQQGVWHTTSLTCLKSFLCFLRWVSWYLQYDCVKWTHIHYKYKCVVNCGWKDCIMQSFCYWPFAHSVSQRLRALSWRRWHLHSNNHNVDFLKKLTTNNHLIRLRKEKNNQERGKVLPLLLCITDI